MSGRSSFLFPQPYDTLGFSWIILLFNALMPVEWVEKQIMGHGCMFHQGCLCNEKVSDHSNVLNPLFTFILQLVIVSAQLLCHITGTETDISMVRVAILVTKPRVPVEWSEIRCLLVSQARCAV